MSVTVPPRDARRGGLVILGGDTSDGRKAADVYAGSGYETTVAEAADDISRLVAALAPPVFVIALPDAAVRAWEVTGIAAASIIGDARMAAVVARPPAVPTILHLDPSTHDELAAEFEVEQPDLPVHRRLDGVDGERLLLLRTLRLFSTNAGGRGEV